jgi:hypothetical protein
MPIGALCDSETTSIEISPPSAADSSGPTTCKGHSTGGQAKGCPSGPACDLGNDRLSDRVNDRSNVQGRAQLSAPAIVPVLGRLNVPANAQPNGRRSARESELGLSYDAEALVSRKGREPFGCLRAEGAKSHPVATRRERKNAAGQPEHRMSNRPPGRHESIPHDLRNRTVRSGSLRHDPLLHATSAKRSRKVSVGFRGFGLLTGDLRMQLHPRMKAGLLLLAVAGTMMAMSPSAEARDGRWGRGGWRGGWDSGWRGGRGWGGYGGYGWYGGYPYYGYAYDYPNYGYSTGYYPNSGYAYDNSGNTTTNYAPSTQPVYGYSQGGCGTTTAAYPPSGPMPGTPGGYNGTPYEGGPTPTYAPGTNAQQRGDMNGQRNGAMNPQMGGNQQPGANNQQNATTPPPPESAAPPSPSNTGNQQNTNTGNQQNTNR